MNVFELKIYKTLGGRSGRGNTWSNKYNFTFNGAISDAAVLAAVTRLVDFEVSFHNPAVNFMRAVVTLVGDESGGVEKGIVRTIDLNRTGGHLAIAGAKIEPLQMVCRLKFGVGDRRGKSNSYRGALIEEQTTSEGSGDPRFEFDPSTHPFGSGNFGAAAIGAGSATPLVVVSKASDGTPPVVSSVTTITYAGLGFRQRTIKRKAKKVEDGKSWVSTAVDVLKELAPLIVFALTKGKALPAAERLPLHLMALQLQSSTDALVTNLDPNPANPV
jgi:hypothetical protein